MSSNLPVRELGFCCFVEIEENFFWSGLSGREGILYSSSNTYLFLLISAILPQITCKFLPFDLHVVNVNSKFWRKLTNLFKKRTYAPEIFSKNNTRNLAQNSCKWFQALQSFRFITVAWSVTWFKPDKQIRCCYGTWNLLLWQKASLVCSRVS